MVEIVCVLQDFWGTPQAGLTPLITIYEVSHGTPSTEVVSAVAMTEIGNGIYIYKFEGRNTIKRYFAYIDGTAAFWIDWLRYNYIDISYNKND